MIGAFRAALRELGLVDGLIYACDRALVRMRCGARLHRYYFVAQPVPEPAAAPARARPGLEIRQIHRGDPAFAATPLSEDVLDFRFGQSTVCLGAFKGDILVGYIWLCLGQYQEDEVLCVLEPYPAARAAWDFDIYILPEYRLSRAFVRLWDGANDYLRERGFAWTLSRIASYNRMSIASHRRLGARILGSAIFLRRGSVQLMAATLPPYLNITILGRGRPRLRLDVT